MLDMSQNKLTKMGEVLCTRLYKLVVDENEIATVDFKRHDALKVLSMNKNKLTTGEGIEGLSVLEDLSIQENEILTLKGMKDLPCLKTLNLSGNKMEKLDDFPELPALTSLVLNGCPIASADELCKLAHLTSLTDLNMEGCPLAEEKGDDFRKEVLIALMDDIKGLKKINGEPFSEEELADAKTTKAERI